MAPAPPQDIDAERNAVGSLLLSAAALPRVIADEGLRPEHFTRPLHRECLRAMMALLDRGDPVDEATVWAELERKRAEREVTIERDALEGLMVGVPSAGHAVAYARRVRELADLRRIRSGALAILDGVGEEDRERIAEGENLLVPEQNARTSRTAEQIAEDMLAYFHEPPSKAWPLPWATLTDAMSGGVRPGTVTVLSGHSSHGKSVVADMIAEVAAKHGANAHLYLTEMSYRERVCRFVSRHSDIPFRRVIAGKFRDDDEIGYLRAIGHWQRLGIGVDETHGWTADDIARDVIIRRWDFAVVDLFNEIEVGEGQTGDYDRAVRVLTAASRRAGTHLLVVAHVNEGRVQSANRPRPTLGDLRSTGMLKNAADNVVFVHREQEENGTLLDKAHIYIAKARNARLADAPVTFNGAHMRFTSLSAEDSQ